MDVSLISFKKGFFRAHTSPNKVLLANESLYSQVQAKSSSIFAQSPSLIPPSVLWENDGVVEKVRLELVPINGCDSVNGHHGFYARLPGNYEELSENQRIGTGFWRNGLSLFSSEGAVQIVPVIFGNNSYAQTLYDENMVVIEPLSSQGCLLYESTGVVFQDNPPGSSSNPSTSPSDPSFLDCWLYIGKMQSEVSSGSFVWAQPSKIIRLSDNVFETPDSFSASSLLVLVNGLAVAQENEDGFEVIGPKTFRMKQSVSLNSWVMAGYVMV
jgi:hypothetical protein